MQSGAVGAGKVDSSATDEESILVNSSGKLEVGTIPVEKRWYGIEGTRLERVVKYEPVKSVNSQANSSGSGCPFDNTTTDTDGDYTIDIASYLSKNFKTGSMNLHNGKVYAFAMYTNRGNSNSGSNYGCKFQVSLYDVKANTWSQLNDIDLNGATGYNTFAKSGPYLDENGNVVDYIAKYASYNDSVDGGTSDRKPHIKVYKITTSISTGVSSSELFADHKFEGITIGNNTGYSPQTLTNGFVVSDSGKMFGTIYAGTNSSGMTPNTDNTIAFVMSQGVFTTSFLMYRGAWFAYDKKRDAAIYYKTGEEGSYSNVKVLTNDLDPQKNTVDATQGAIISDYSVENRSSYTPSFVTNSNYSDYSDYGAAMMFEVDGYSNPEWSDVLFGNYCVRGDGLVTCLEWDGQSGTYKEVVLVDSTSADKILPPIPGAAKCYIPEVGVFCFATSISDTLALYCIDGESGVKTTVLDYRYSGSSNSSRASLVGAISSSRRILLDDGDSLSCTSYGDNPRVVSNMCYGKLFEQED